MCSETKHPKRKDKAMKLLPKEIKVIGIFTISTCILHNAVADAVSDYRDSMAWADAEIAKKQQDEKAAKYEKNTELKSPKLGLIRNISPYEKTTEMLGFNNSEGPYLILLEDYKFKDFDGNEYTIPAGFIFDGTSLPTSHDEGCTDRSPVGFGIQILMPDQTKYSSLAEGMIHDYMYRHPNQFTKETADLLFRSNLTINGNARADTLYQGVALGGSSSYNEHLTKTRDGKYEFTEEYYKEDLDIWSVVRRRPRRIRLNDIANLAADKSVSQPILLIPILRTVVMGRCARFRVMAAHPAAVQMERPSPSRRPIPVSVMVAAAIQARGFGRG